MDCKALINIEFEIFGEKYKKEMYINYFPTDNGVDERIGEFFRESYSNAVKTNLQESE